MQQNRLVTICFIVLLLFIFYSTALLLLPFFQALFWAGILAFACYPIYRWFIDRFGWSEVPAALLITIVLALVVVPPVTFVIVNLAIQAGGFYQESISYVQSGRLEQFLISLEASDVFQQVEQQLSRWGAAKENVIGWVLESLKTLGNFTARQIGTVMKNVAVLGFNIFLTFCLVFILLKDGARIYRFFYQIAPLSRAVKKAVFGQINETLGAVIRGQLLTSIAQSLIAGIIYWVLGVPFPVLFGALTFIASMIPIVGASIVWVPLVIYLALTQHHIQAGSLFVLGVAAISLVDNFLKPMLIGERTKLPYFLLFLGILGGVKVYGLTGIFVAPVVLSLFFALITIYQKEFLKDQ